MPDEFELRLTMKEGLSGQPLTDNTAVVQLDTTVRPELEREGIARDFVRMIQQRRKDKNFDVSDRISLVYQTDSDEIKQALQEHKDYIMEQVLAIRFDATKTPFKKPEELGNSTLTFDIQKA